MKAPNPFRLPFVSYLNKDRLPMASGIYYLINRAQQTILYIGQAKNIRQRWHNHHRLYETAMLVSVYGDAIAIAWELCSIEKLGQFEKTAIAQHQSLLNYKSGHASLDVLYENRWEDLPEYYRYLVTDLSDLVYQHFPKTQIEYLLAKANLMELLNYRHPITAQTVPVYRYFESEGLFTYAANAHHSKTAAFQADAIYAIGNQDIQTALQCGVAPEDIVYYPLQGNVSVTFETLFYGASTLLADLSIADVKANNEIEAVADFWNKVFEVITAPKSEELVLELVSVEYRKAAEESWDDLIEGAIASVEGLIDLQEN